MAGVTYKSIDEYIAAQPTAAQKILERVRTAIRQALPDADEVISYNMPTYKMHGVTLLHFAASKAHYALYLSTKPIEAAFKDELRNCDIDKGTIRFSFAEPVPQTLIKRIAKFRVQQA